MAAFPFKKIDEEGTKALFHKLLDAGVNYIDTARAYTVSEAYIGYALEGIREHFVLATKSMAHTREAMEQDIATSLEKLRTDYIDLYQLHNPNEKALEEILAPGGAIEDAETALRYVVSNPNVTVVIPGMAEAGEIEQNAQAVGNTAPLTDAEQEKISGIRELLGTNFCRRCNYCAPCSAGINIPMIFLIEGYFSRYHLTDWASTRYDGLAKTASDCIGCGVCEERCPYHLPIRDMMKNAVRVFQK